jgi:hypothetical protein
VTITVAATTGQLQSQSHGLEWAAFFGLLGVCGLRSRKRLARLLAVVLMVAGAAGMSGCGGGTTSGGSTTTPTKPSGSQTVTYTLSNSLATTSTSIVVNIQ